MGVLRHITEDKFSIIDGFILSYAGHLMLTHRYAESFALTVVGMFLSGVLTGVVRVISKTGNGR